MSRYGFLTDLRQQARSEFNPGNLPVGMTKYYDAKLGANCRFHCSLCHSANFTIAHGDPHRRGSRCTPSPSMKPGQFQAD